ncbi:uncharacterized protein [Engystomops pustulosus]|uniref:uncharacterized protein n=1 Tax=Engystomops pustulosus TaxID=76066 RepID=UPI003AFAAD13
MPALLLLVIVQVFFTRLLTYHPEDVVFVDRGNSLNLTCVSNATNGTRLVTWYRRTEHHKWTEVKNHSQKSSRPKANISYLVVDNFTAENSGRYFCSVFETQFQVFNNATTVISADILVSNATIHLLTPLERTTHSFPMPLACVVHTASQHVYVNWNISGIHIKGRTISLKTPNGTWTIINSILLPGNTWQKGERVICEAWFNSTPISAYWEIPQKVGTLSSCPAWVKMSLLCGVILMLASFAYVIYKHLEQIRTQKIHNKSHESGREEIDNLIYTELRINSQALSRR